MVGCEGVGDGLRATVLAVFRDWEYELDVLVLLLLLLLPYAYAALRLFCIRRRVQQACADHGLKRTSCCVCNEQSEKVSRPRRVTRSVYATVACAEWCNGH